MRLASVTVLCLFAVNAFGGIPDSDRDGLPDEFEQALLLKFVPSFHVSLSDCDVAPAEFHKNAAEPRVKARNGTIYGQVFPARRDGPDAYIEIHYYHLWARDCGRTGHPLGRSGRSEKPTSTERPSEIDCGTAAQGRRFSDLRASGPRAKPEMRSSH